jgi:hypothetical protein
METFEFHLDDGASIVIVDPLSGVEIVERGTYPIVSDLLELGNEAVGNSYSTWLATWLSPDQNADERFTSATADIDGDGAANLIEYLFSSNPLVSGTAHRASFSEADDSTITITYEGISSPADLGVNVEVEVEAADANGIWSSASTYEQVKAVDWTSNADGSLTLRVQVQRHLANRAIALRLRVSQQ